MRFGLSGGAQSSTAAPAQGYHDHLDFLLEAEALGYHGRFLAEHHFTAGAKSQPPAHADLARRPHIHASAWHSRHGAGLAQPHSAGRTGDAGRCAIRRAVLAR